MGKVFEAIDGRIREFIERQHVFFVATAPAGAGGHVNCSPKGLDTLRVLGPREVAYHDFTGSGAETIAHLRENGRIVMMFCAFEGVPMIVRLHGRGTVVEPGDPDFAGLAAHFPAAGDVRSIIQVAVERIGDSCGFGVPLFRYEGERTQLPAWAEAKERTGGGLAAYRREKNARSIDGLPALRFGTAPPDAGPRTAG